jgi:hypothetical protein
MRCGLLFGADQVVADWAFAQFGYKPSKFDKAVGVIRCDTQALVGDGLFQCYNGNDVQFSYYGRATLSAGIVRAMARIAVVDFDVSRATIVTSRRNKSLVRFLGRTGFRLEGAMRCFYGRVDAPRNTGLRFVIFRPELARLAGLATAERRAPGTA